MAVCLCDCRTVTQIALIDSENQQLTRTSTKINIIFGTLSLNYQGGKFETWCLFQFEERCWLGQDFRF